MCNCLYQSKEVGLTGDDPVVLSGKRRQTPKIRVGSEWSDPKTSDESRERIELAKTRKLQRVEVNSSLPRMG